MALQKPLFHIFHVTTLGFSVITLIVIPSSYKMVSGVPTYRLPHDLQLNRQTKHLSLQSKLWFILCFLSGEASKFLSNTYALTNLTPKTTTPLAPYLSFHRVQLRSH